MRGRPLPDDDHAADAPQVSGPELSLRPARGGASRRERLPGSDIDGPRRVWRRCVHG